MSVNFSICSQLHPLTLFRIIPTSGKSKQVTIITGFFNTVNAQAVNPVQWFTGNIELHTGTKFSQSNLVTHLSQGLFYYWESYSVWLQIVSYTPVNDSLGGQLQSLTLFRNILTLDESKQVTFITATFRKL